ncbi:ABC transporter permease [Chryseosolibacter indicus]|uniref:ABC transporter permease n=1 Tax=Chryseosolibacter indicus TaxID=2782351 RepID=A0ABS5VVT1_9BACT|nr:ABC transporter permease [Chryseosolibacter indicus]MBT1705158.1 ABC transporter permease [Chryseosolibacter indicus]
MLISYFKTAIRNFVRHKYFSLLNVLGLALGMSVSLLFISFYSFVSSFDDFHSKGDKIYRIISTVEKGVKRTDLASAPFILTKVLENEVPEIEEVVCINAAFSSVVVSSKVNIPVQGYYADDNFFSVFDFKLIQGNPRTALLKPNSILLKESVATKLGKSRELIGSMIEIEGAGLFEVTGIVKDESLSHFSFEVLVSMSTLPDTITQRYIAGVWKSFRDQYIYILASDQTRREKLQESLDRITNILNEKARDSRISLKLQALADITPGPDLENSLGPDTDYLLIFIFGTISLLILAPACFNYSNIFIARALKRSKEVGLRKTMGGAKLQIFAQFIAETVTMTVISLFGALIIFFLIRPEFEDMMPGNWLDLSLTWEMVAVFLVFAIATGMITGVLPALHFAGLNPIQSLKGLSVNNKFSRMRIRKVLVVFQFGLSFCFIVLMFIFSKQYQYNLNYNYGFNTDNILDVELQGLDPAKFDAEFSRLAEVQTISKSSGILGMSFTETYVREQSGKDSLAVVQLFVDSNYIENMDLLLVAGRNFPPGDFTQERHIIVNEEFVHAWNIDHAIDAIGKTFLVDGNYLEVIGVLKNFHYAPLHTPIRSFFFRTDTSQFRYANVKLTTNDIKNTMTSMEKTWSTLHDSRKLEAKFFDDEMEEFYFFYRKLLEMIGYLGVLAISISVLGLLGMVIYTTEWRTKEAGIRKVFGASDSGIAWLLSKDFLKLMFYAIALGIPISSWLFDDFLSAIQYYRVSIGIWDIVISVVIFFVVGVLAIASQVRKVAVKNPVDTLRYE